jgi:hypothetical protein
MKSSLGIAFAALTLTLALLRPMPASAADYPNVGELHPFTAECNYMSNAGYLRFLVFARDGLWLTRSESVAIVQTQSTAAGE